MKVTIILFFVLTLAGCGEKSVTLPEQPLSTNPKDYLWSGKIGSEYVYEATETLRDSAGKDTSYIAYTDRYVIDDDDTLLPNGIRGKRLRLSRSYPDTTLTYTINYYAVDGRIMRTDLPMPIIPKAVDTVLVGVMALGNNVQDGPSESEHFLSTVVATNQTVTTPSGTYRTIVTEKHIDSVSITFPDGTIIGNGSSTYTQSYSPGLMQVRTEAIAELTHNFRTKWRSRKFVRVLRSASIK